MSVQPFAPLLMVPPFPGANFRPIATFAQGRPAGGDSDVDELTDALRRRRVGGTYWGAQPALPEGGHVLVRVREPNGRCAVLDELPGDQPIVCWLDDGVPKPQRLGGQGTIVTGCADPWHLLAGAVAAIVDADDPVAAIAAALTVPTRLADRGTLVPVDRDMARALIRKALLDDIGYCDPFTGEGIDAARAVELCGHWRDLIDRNRDIWGAVGFAAWKRRTVAPLLWGGPGTPRFIAGAAAPPAGSNVAIWKARVAVRTLARLEAGGVRLIEVEDGFIRSAGLGADCVPPLSIVVDRIGAYFDPRQPSALEQMLEQEVFPDELIARAGAIRRLIVEAGISKYETGSGRQERPGGGRRRVLVPGQVEDDRAVQLGGQGLTSNLELLRRVRSEEPDAVILYKPHPDVEAGHRRGGISDRECLASADEIVRNQPISTLIDLVDEVHVNTSLAGFEALLRGKPVTTHGVPFYAGWGLTRDLGSVPKRRTARRTIDELAAAVLLLYPRYLDPITGLPCPPEILVRRLSEGSAQRAVGPLVWARRLLGQVRRSLTVSLPPVAG